MVGSCGRCAAAGRLPQRVSGHRAPSSPSAMAVAAVGRRGSGLAWELEDCLGICLAATERRRLSQTRGTIQNKGWDGYDVQWECKTDLDIAYKFGKTVVSCEGYESSEDQYVLRGSCGLEYNLDYTELGLKKLKESGKHQGFSDYYHKLYSSDSCGFITIAVLFVLAFAVYKLFLSDGQGSPPPYSEHPLHHLPEAGPYPTVEVCWRHRRL